MIFWFEKHNKISGAIVILIAIVIFYLSSLSFESTSSGGFGWKTIVYHFYAFFFLSLFLLIFLVKGKFQKRNFIFLALILSISYGISDEIHQFFVPFRSFTIFDIFVDLAGVLFAGYLYLLIILGKKTKNKHIQGKSISKKKGIIQKKSKIKKKNTSMKHEFKIYFLLVIALILAFGIYFLIISLYVNPFLENYSDLNRGSKILQFYQETEDCNQIYYWGSSSIKEDIDANLIDKINPAYCNYNLGNPASTPLRRLIELKPTISSKPSAVIFGVTYTSFSDNWLFPYDQYALISKDIEKKEIPIFYNETYKELLSMNELKLLLYKRKFIAPATKNLLEHIRSKFFKTKNPSYFKEYNQDFKSEGILLQETEENDPQFNFTLENKKDFSEYAVPPKENIEKSSFEFIIKELSKNNIKVIIVEAPMNPLLLDKIDSESKDNFEGYLKNISEKHKISILDYTSVYDSNYFYDGHHLNKKGREIFSQDLGLEIFRII